MGIIKKTFTIFKLIFENEHPTKCICEPSVQRTRKSNAPSTEINSQKIDSKQDGPHMH